MNDTNFNKAKLICVDWGSSNFRAFLLDETGQLIDSLYIDRGMLQLEPNEFEPTLFELLKNWPKTPVIMAGMVGSLMGWKNASYVTCPASLGSFSENLTEITNTQHRKIVIISGVQNNAEATHYDVARGEETQVIGALEWSAFNGDGMICLPGTHSKWIEVKNKQITKITTHMTGEIFALLTQHSILASRTQNTSTTADKAIIERGISMAKQSGGVAHHLFTARANMLNGSLDAAQVNDYVSGILVGAEIIDMLKTLPNLDEISLIGSSKLLDIYNMAFELLGVRCHQIDGEKSAYTGMFVIAQKANFI